MENMIEEMARQNDRVIGLCVVLLVVVIGLAWMYCTAFSNRQKEIAKKTIAKAETKIRQQCKDEIRHEGARHFVEKYYLIKELKETKAQLQAATKELSELRELANACTPTGVRIARKK